jgi:hypothetical protein
MSDLLEHNLREALADRATRMTPETISRLRAIDYHPRSRSRPSLPALGALGLSAGGVATAAAILLGSSAPAAFAGWTAKPTAPRPGQLAAAAQGCAAGAGTPLLTDTRGPYTATIYANGSTCIQGNGMTISSGGQGGAASVPSVQIQLNGVGESDADGHALTMVDGRVGSGVTAVTITRSDGTSVQATVKNGWYLAWWPGSEHATTAKVTSATGTSTQSFPSVGGRQAPPCPAGADCSSGYGFLSAGSGSHGSVQSSARAGGAATSSKQSSARAGGSGTSSKH